MLAPGAQAQVTSTGATRVYRSRSRDRVASQRASSSIAADAYLEYLPDQLIPFAGSRFEQTTRVELAARRFAHLVGPRRARPRGVRRSLPLRIAHVAFRSCSADGEPVAMERWTIAPRDQRLDSIARLGPFRHFASCYVCRAGEPAPLLAQASNPTCSVVADQLSSPESIMGSDFAAGARPGDSRCRSQRALLSRAVWWKSGKPPSGFFVAASPRFPEKFTDRRRVRVASDAARAGKAHDLCRFRVGQKAPRARLEAELSGSDGDSLRGDSGSGARRQKRRRHHVLGRLHSHARRRDGRRRRR